MLSLHHAGILYILRLGILAGLGLDYEWALVFGEHCLEEEEEGDEDDKAAQTWVRPTLEAFC